jgi:hypothetical protein
MKTIRGSLILLAAALLVVAAFSTSAGAAARKAKQPPCTKKALSAGLTRGGDKQPSTRLIRPWKCVSGWAYSEGVAGQDDVVLLFRAKHGKWYSANRGTWCPKKSSLPKKIWQGACTSD